MMRAICFALCVAMPFSAMSFNAVGSTPVSPAKHPDRHASDTHAPEAPLAAAQRLYTAYQGDGIASDPTLLAEPLNTLVKQDEACSHDAQACEISANPWLAGGSQEGRIEGEPEFTLVNADAYTAEVRMDYTYAWDDAHKEPQSTTLHLSRPITDAPWKLHDLGNKDQRLLRRLQAVYGNGEQ